jgi:hypothetical protein
MVRAHEGVRTPTLVNAVIVPAAGRAQLYRDVEFEDPTLSSTAARATRGD